MRRAAGQVGLPDLPMVLPGGAAGKQDAASIVGDSRIRRRKETGHHVAAPFGSHQNQVRPVRKPFPALVPGRRFVTRRRGVKKWRQIGPLRLSGQE